MTYNDLYMIDYVMVTVWFVQTSIVLRTVPNGMNWNIHYQAEEASSFLFGTTKTIQNTRSNDMKQKEDQPTDQPFQESTIPSFHCLFSHQISGIPFDSGKTIITLEKPGGEDSLLVAAVFKWEQQDQSTRKTLATYVFADFRG